MARESFDLSLNNLQTRLLAMGSLVEENIRLAITALLKRDMALSRRLIEGDNIINEQRISIMMDCLKLIATQQPTAKDMRFIAAVLEIVGELERINDYVKGIGRTSIDLGEREVLYSLSENLPLMGDLTKDMLRRALDGFAQNDEALARSVPPSDDMVDNLFKKMYADILDYVRENSHEVERASQLEWIIHNLERAADRVINICEWVIYMATGVYQEIESEYESPPIIVE